VNSSDCISDSIQSGIYRHYKGAEYQVLEVAIHSETEELLVVYRPMYKVQQGKQKLWVRPLEMFVETVEVDGVQVKRFELIRAS